MKYCTECKGWLRDDTVMVEETYYGTDAKNTHDKHSTARWRTIRKPYHPECVPEVEE